MESLSLGQELQPPGEEAFTRGLAERLQAKIIQDNPIGIMRRDAHPKMHGLVKAEFIIEPDLPDDLRVGVFSRPRSYHSWIRFSNSDGKIKPDIKSDIRGMAIKLMSVEGVKLLDEARWETTQDFILISTNIFVTRDVEEFALLVNVMTTGNWFMKMQFLLTHLRVTRNLFMSLKKVANPLQIRYWSTTPYLLGSHAVKYSAIPTGEIHDKIPRQPANDFLRHAMVRQLEDEDVSFDFAVQLQSDPYSMPIEDPGREWSETESPFRKVATIRIPRQVFDSEAQRQFGENLSFTPWHSLPEHRPLGGINRARKLIYHVIATFRRNQNNVPVEEPNGWN